MRFHLSFSRPAALAEPVDTASINGEYMSVGGIVEKLIKDKPFFDESGGGVTVSGGEALLQADFVRELLNELKSL